VETLRDAGCVLAEDTRRTRTLLTHYGIGGKTVLKLDANASDRDLDRVVDRLKKGERMALVTDAGTPSVSDPGTALVRRAVSQGIFVTAIPGPSAVTTAVALSGLVDGPFFFLVFLPRKGERRRHAIERISGLPEPVVLFEAPSRLAETLDDLAGSMPERSACVARELTKLHEEALRGSLSELSKQDVVARGEVTIVLGPTAETLSPSSDDIDALIARRLEQGLTIKQVATEVAARTGIARRDAYARALSSAGRAPVKDD
jgi:16S rRNA (cytidine1402-2'-O)-methyltransferase